MRKMNLQLFAESIPAAGKIKRKWMAHYIDAALPSASKADYSRLGKDLEEYIVEMNANVETKNNIWGETSVNLDSYQPQASADPYYAEIGEPLFERLQGIVDERQTLEGQIPVFGQQTALLVTVAAGGGAVAAPVQIVGLGLQRVKQPQEHLLLGCRRSPAPLPAPCA